MGVFYSHNPDLPIFIVSMLQGKDSSTTLCRRRLRSSGGLIRHIAVSGLHERSKEMRTTGKEVNSAYPDYSNHRSKTFEELLRAYSVKVLLATAKPLGNAVSENFSPPSSGRRLIVKTIPPSGTFEEALKSIFDLTMKYVLIKL